MVLQPAQTRQSRVYHNGTGRRSRYGCVTCRAKHIKCDEAKPACLNCTNKGFQCGGYQREVKWSDKDHTGRRAGRGSTTTSTANVSRTSMSARSRKILPIERVHVGWVRIGPASSTSSPRPQAAEENEDSDDTTAREAGASPKESAAHAAMQSPTTTTLPGELARPQYRRTAPALHSHNSNKNNNKDTSAPVSRTTLPASPSLDTPSRLIVTWFDQVCPAWSIFDSPLNLNRQKAMVLWHSSELVYVSLQSMSAAFLASKLSRVGFCLQAIFRQAAQMVHAELVRVKQVLQIRALQTIPKALIFSMFCLFTTMTWRDPSFLGQPLLAEIKFLLTRLDKHLFPLSGPDQQDMDYFRKCLMYYEMHLAAVSDIALTKPASPSPPSSPPPHMSDVLEQAATVASDDGGEDDSETENSVVLALDLSPHPWTGISTRIAQLLAQAMRLCRAYRRQARLRRRRFFWIESTILDDAGAEDTTEMYGEALRLEETLLGLAFPSASQESADTGDAQTSWNHLAKVAEAHRLSALLQLYQTFPDLVLLRLPEQQQQQPLLPTPFGASMDGCNPWADWIVPLGLHLIDVLKDIPLYSRAQVAQPLLYIMAGSTLRYGVAGQEKESSPAPTATQDASIANAREFIMGRLNILEYTLPPYPFIQAKKILKSVWDGYDGKYPGGASVNWMDVMEDKKLHCIFG